MISEEIESAIRRLLEKTLSNAEREELEKVVRADAAASKKYDDLSFIDRALSELASEQETGEGKASVASQPERTLQSFREAMLAASNRPTTWVMTLCRVWQGSHPTEFDTERFARSWTRFEESGLLEEGRPLEFVGSLPSEGQALEGGDRPPGFETLLITLAANVVWDYRKRGKRLLGEKREKVIKRHLKLVGKVSPHEELARQVLNFLLEMLASQQP